MAVKALTISAIANCGCSYLLCLLLLWLGRQGHPDLPTFVVVPPAAEWPLPCEQSVELLGGYWGDLVQARTVTSGTTTKCTYMH